MLDMACSVLQTRARIDATNKTFVDSCILLHLLRRRPLLLSSGNPNTQHAATSTA
jgi:hypothetical protein